MVSVIYVVSKQFHRTGSNGYEYVESEVDLDCGFFLTKEEAEAFVEALDKEPREQWKRTFAEYEARVNAWTAKSKEARALGYMIAEDYPFIHGEEPLPHEVTIIYPHGSLV